MDFNSYERVQKQFLFKNFFLQMCFIYFKSFLICLKLHRNKPCNPYYTLILIYIILLIVAREITLVKRNAHSAILRLPKSRQPTNLNPHHSNNAKISKANQHSLPLPLPLSLSSYLFFLAFSLSFLFFSFWFKLRSEWMFTF